jgi:polar amino acid transport system permease protein
MIILADPVFIDQLFLNKTALAKGMYLTAYISIIAIVAGTLLGVLVGLLLSYGLWINKLIARVYVDFIRGTPVLVLVLAAFYVLSALGVNLSAVQAGIFALTVFASSHVAEMVRGALKNIHKGQTEAAYALGLTFSQTFVFILMPQALRQILPTWINASVETLKASTLVSVIGVGELILTTQQVISRNFMSLEFYMFAGFLFFLLGYSIERIGKYAERKVSIS